MVYFLDVVVLDVARIATWASPVGHKMFALAALLQAREAGENSAPVGTILVPSSRDHRA
jgi:hypothetical protein